MKCLLCNKILKSEKSIQLGYGPSCFKKSGLIKKKGKLIRTLVTYK